MQNPVDGFILAFHSYQNISAVLCVSDLLENIVNTVDVHHLENCQCKSSSVKLTECDHVFDAFDPYHLFLRPCGRLFSTDVLSVRMMKCIIHLFSFWSTSHGCTGASE
jgi:hypothetical protein